MTTRKAPALHVATLADYRLTAYCATCERYQPLDADQLARECGPAATVDALRRRLRCTTCGQPGRLLVDGSDHHSANRPAVRGEGG